MTIAIYLFISIIIVGIQTAIPYLVKRNVVFGVTVPENNLEDNEPKSYKKNYSLLIGFLSCVALVIFFLWATLQAPSNEKIVLVGTYIQFGIILLSLSLYFYYHGKMSRLKKANRWDEVSIHTDASHLSIQAHNEMLPWYVFLLPMLISVGVIGYTLIQYDLLPEQIPTHWGINGEPDAFTEKTLMSAIMMPLVLLLIQWMFLGIQLGTKKSGLQSSSSSFQPRQRTLKKYTSWFMFFVSLGLTGLLSFFQLQTIHPELFSGTAMFVTPLVFLVATLVGTIVFALRVGLSDKGPVEYSGKESHTFDDDAYWKGGLFYYNKNDKSIFVEKRFGVGWTLNFANPMGYFIVLLPLVAIILFTFL